MNGEERRDLSPEDRAILDFELSWSRFRGSKRRAVEERFGIPLATYYRRRGKLVNRPEAAGYAPALVRRLRGEGPASGGAQIEGLDT